MSSAQGLRVPGDKSVTHRALLLAALADGESLITGALDAADTRSTAAVLQALGVPISWSAERLVVRGAGLQGLRPPAGPLDCGNSGTTTRLLLGILAAQPLTATLTGDASLRRRPMRRVTAPLRQMGARFRELGEADRLPIEVSGGGLQGIAYDSPHASAQVKSAVLLAALAGGVPASVREPIRSRDHTERMLRALGVPVSEETGAGGHQVAIEPVPRLPALELAVPGDFSAAAFLLAAGLLLPGGVRVQDVGMNPTRTGLLAVLARMGASVQVEGERACAGEPVATLRVSPAPLRGTEVGAAELPALIDEVPVLAALAARASGDTVITGAAELRVKESDRISTVVGNLRALGVAAEELPDGMVVHGTDRPLRGTVRTEGDHRIAMAFGVLAAQPENHIVIDEPEAVAVSFPGFWDALAGLGTTP